MEKYIPGFRPDLLIVSGLFLLTFLLQVWVYFRFYRRAILKKPLIFRKADIQPEPLSIIICARNEAPNLEKNLPLILEQNYPDYEVIVVNDRSEDETSTLLDKFALKYKNLHISEVKNDPVFTSGKKLALTLGIKAASHEWLLLTDADCEVSSNNWISEMQKNFTENIEIVLGYGGYKKEKGLLNLLIRFETVFTAMQYFGMAIAGRPYMGVGRNLAYRKSLFFKNKGFASHSNLLSGDDDLFVNETANSKNVAVEMNPSSFTWSECEKTFKGWYLQKLRHLSTASRYKFHSRTVLFLENLSRVLFLGSFIYLLFFPHKEIALSLFGILLITKGIIFKLVFSRLNESNLFLPSLVIEPVIPLFYGFLHIRNLTDRKRKRWN